MRQSTRPLASSDCFRSWTPVACCSERAETDPACTLKASCDIYHLRSIIYCRYACVKLICIATCLISVINVVYTTCRRIKPFHAHLVTKRFWHGKTSSMRRLIPGSYAASDSRSLKRIVRPLSLNTYSLPLYEFQYICVAIACRRHKHVRTLCRLHD